MKNKFHFATFSAAALLVASFASGAVPGLSATETPITRAEINLMTYKVNMASRFFEATWRQVFSSAGRQAPPLVACEEPMVLHNCPEHVKGNALYMHASHTIYYDVIFFTRMMKGAAAAVGTDGDYAPIVILAHEMGHAVALTLGVQFGLTYPGEALADCLAGVVTNKAKAAGNLETGDLQEGLWALNEGGDAVSTSIFAKGAHGKGPDRQRAFMQGYNSGLSACSGGIAGKISALQPPAQQPASRTFPTSLTGGYQSR